MKLLLIIICLYLTNLALAQNYNSFATEIVGVGKPMILIHGLYCKAEVWNQTVTHYQKIYQCHLLTLAGFAGQKPYRRDSILYTVKEDIARYIKEKKLDKPVITGHSLGAFLGLWLASSYPDLVGPIICIDGVPFLPAMQLPEATVQSSKEMAANMKKYMSIPDPKIIRANQKMYLPTMISDTNKINLVIEWAVASDAATIGQAMYELFTTDLRKEIKNIKSPVLELGTWIAYKAYGADHGSAVSLLKNQFKELPGTTIKVTDKARHFIMYDEPLWMLKEMDTFLCKNVKNGCVKNS